MLGHLAPEVLATGGLVNVCTSFLMIVFWGIFSTLAILIAHHKNSDQEISQLFKSSLCLAGICGIIIGVIFFHLDYLFVYLHQSLTVIAIARPYIHILSFSFLPSLLIFVIDQLFFGLNKPKVIMHIALLFLPINLGLNYLLMYGKLGLPALGILGLGWGTLITSIINMAVLFLIVGQSSTFKKYLHLGQWMDKTALKELLSNGVPTGFTWLVEIGFFSTVAFLMGIIGISALAAHELSFQTDILAFTLAVNMGQALQIMIGEAAGSKDYARIRPTFWLAQIILICLLAVVALLIWCAPHTIIYIGLGAPTSANTAVINIALKLLMILPIFLCLDSIGFMTFSALRGLKANRFSLGVVLMIYWLGILPIMTLGVVHYHYFDPVDLWIFLCIGAAMSVTLQFWRFQYLCRKHYS